jgi:hypothetical protein
VRKLASVSRLVLSILVLTVAVAACSSGKMANTLDRPTALIILQEAGPELLKGQVTKCDITTRVPITPARGWDQKRGDMTIAFLDLLAQVGVLKDKTQTPGSGYVMFNYTIVPQENVEPMDQLVLITLARPAVREVAGIRQEGTEAFVDASIAAVPTPLYERTVDAGKALFSQCDSFPDPKPYFCVHWPSREKLGVQATRNFHFARYDDGWRVVG